MNRSLLVLGITLAAALPARADLTHRIQSSVQLEVGGASTRAVRLGNTYSVSGSGVSTTDGSTAGAIGGLGAHTNGVNALTIPVTATQADQLATPFSFANSLHRKVTPFQHQPRPLGRFQPFGDVTSALQLAPQALAWLAQITTAGAITDLSRCRQYQVQSDKSSVS